MVVERQGFRRAVGVFVGSFVCGIASVYTLLVKDIPRVCRQCGAESVNPNPVVTPLRGCMCHNYAVKDADIHISSIWEVKHRLDGPSARTQEGKPILEQEKASD